MMYSNYYFPFPKTLRSKASCAVDYSPKVNQSILPKLNAFQKDEVLNLEFSMPGVLKEDVKIQLDQFVLSLTATRKSTHQDGTAMHKEFGEATYARKIQLPEDIDVESLKARFENGVLLIQMNRIKKAIHKIEVQ